MATINNKSSGVTEFVLICFPGIQGWQHWLSIPITLLFLVTLTANITLLATIYSSPSLHKPMYYFLCLLAAMGLLVSFSVSPKTLSILLFDDRTTRPVACFSQIFIVLFCHGMEGSIFVCLAYDRYIAICDPLHHFSIITTRRTVQASALLLIGNTVAFLPYPLLAAKLNFCADNIIPHCLCENLPVAKLACDSIAANNFYHIVVIGSYIGVMSLALAFSYCMILRAVLRLGSLATATKALGTCSSHLILISFYYSTVILTSVSNRMEKLVPRDVSVMLSLLQSHVFPALNALIYGIRTTEIRQEALKLLGRIWQMCIATWWIK